MSMRKIVTVALVMTNCVGIEKQMTERESVKKGPRLPVKAKEEVAGFHPRKLVRVSVYQAKKPVRRKGL